MGNMGTVDYIGVVVRHGGDDTSSRDRICVSCTSDVSATDGSDERSPSYNSLIEPVFLNTSY